MTNSLQKTSMRKLQVALCALILLSLAWIPGRGQGVFPAVAGEVEDGLWSFSFNNVSVAEVLKQLSEKTGIDIVTSRPPQEKRVTKSYENQTIEEILRDVFRGANYTLVWDYDDRGIESIAVNFFDQGGARSDRVSGASRFNRRSQALERDAGDDVEPSSRRFIRPRRPTTTRARTTTGPRKPPPKEADEDDEDEGDEDADEEDSEEDSEEGDE